MLSAGSDLCELLIWDTEFFGQRIGRIRGSRLDPESLGSVLRWSEENEIACLYFLADLSDSQTIRLAERYGFSLVDVRMTLERRLVLHKPPQTTSDVGESVTIRASIPADIPMLQALARNNHRDTRFYFDFHFPEERCGDLYDMWIRRSCEGYADWVWVAILDDTPVGYITCCLLKDRSEGQIGLMGVGAEGRGRGIGTRLVLAAIEWFVSQGVSTAVVVTQGRNVAAQRLYQSCGFVTRAVDLWYHKWFTESSSSREKE